MTVDTFEAVARTQAAIALFAHTLHASERVLGPDDAVALTLRNNLGCAYESDGWLREAIALLQLALDDRVRILGGEQPTPSTHAPAEFEADRAQQVRPPEAADSRKWRPQQNPVEIRRREASPTPPDCRYGHGSSPRM
ncbi:hypothetical protein HDA40_001975 [Hamadaea flava]|uniref:Tetratricopeptide repeat protein n=1 Tax=Hamadaea flava TaxID=1742688 RepID=A0ABV8LZE2_9ACTN|nr:tetratricopeptide repeat protein [Hamadaea flava]MCP2323468.1 hypothetical protein [Hamadaea flava]